MNISFNAIVERGDLQMSYIEVNIEKCKGCGLCVTACPFKLIKMSEKINSTGNFYALQTDKEKCVGCALCGTMCPDACIAVFKEI